MNRTQSALLDLVAIGIGRQRLVDLTSLQWNNLLHLSQMQEVTGLVLDGINKYFEKKGNLEMDFQIKMKWIGLTNQIETQYAHHEKVMRELADFYKKHEIRMMVLKGYGLSLNYPIPNHRKSGDIDIYLFGEHKKADKLIHDKFGVDVDNSHHHHTIFYFKEVSVENHYDFLNVHVRKSNLRIEKVLKELANKDYIEAGNVILPSAEFNAIHLLRHCAAHFASTKMNMRQVLDWGFFMEKHRKEIKWDEYIVYLKEEGMYRFYNIIGLFCMRELGFDAAIFHGLYDDKLYYRFRDEILSPEFKDKENGNLLKSLYVKPRRWWHNRWKNRLCYPDSAWSEFAYGLWTKILKPSHFIQ